MEQERARVQMFARTLQRSLLPPLLSPPEGLEASAHYHAASADDVGGDFYDLFPLTHDTWAFFIGDVSGKGAGAAAVTSLTRYTLRAAAVFDANPVTVLQNLHTVLTQEFRETVNQFATVIFGIVASCDGGFVIELASGGHLPPLLLGATESTLRRHGRRPPRRNPMGRGSFPARSSWGRATRWCCTPMA